MNIFADCGTPEPSQSKNSPDSVESPETKQLNMQIRYRSDSGKELSDQVRYLFRK